ncbi:hypothetical protein OPT61_g5028 [Boeremia exigua]|uniref:Uncharacterized protein n=1 Tax=Boeremia exigua TaxID=749465 RepID=A0ACC2IC22_9PLEO|nr:hypothetical protein OPT61_g5028 [Boeremia exigua]
MRSIEAQTPGINVNFSTKRPPLRLIIQPVNIRNQILRLMPVLTILPLAPIIHTPNLIVQPDRTAYACANILAMLHTIPQQTHTERTSVLAHAVIQQAEVETVFKRTVLYELPLRDLFVVVDQADDVAEAFGLAVFALDAVVFVGEPDALAENDGAAECEGERTGR